jgi:homocysteine S-methyltransferase
MNNFARRLNDGGPIIVDGGLATQLEAMGHDISGALWSAVMLASNPGEIVAAHRAYLDAGADVIISASYQASRAGFMSNGYSAEEADRLIASSVELALTAREQFMAANPDSPLPVVAASVGPWGATQQDGSEYTGVYDITESGLREFHEERLPLLDAAGADVLAVETIPNALEAEVLCELLRDVSTPAWVSFACRDDRHLSDGTPLSSVASHYASHDRVLALGINCTAPRFVGALIGRLREAAPDKSIVVYPNSGETYHASDNSWSGEACDLDADFDVAGWHAAGAGLIGGCCRTSPADIAAIRSRLVTGQARCSR